MQSSTATRRSRLALFAVVALAVGLTLLSGVLHGRLTQRWDNPATWAAAVERLQHVPESFGDWQMESAPALGKSAIELLQCRGYLHRVYRHRRTGRQLRVAVMVGPGSRMSIHVPEICYEADNYTLVAPRERIEVARAGRSDSFWSVRFRLNDVSEQPMQVLYAWNRGDAWLAPRYPRWSVAGAPVLYKLQLSSVGPIPVRSEEGQEQDSDGVAFLREFLPLLDASANLDRAPADANETPAAAARDGQSTGIHAELPNGSPQARTRSGPGDAGAVLCRSLWAHPGVARATPPRNQTLAIHDFPDSTASP